MTLEETERFYRCMSDHYRNKSVEDRAESRMLWDHLLDVLKAVRECDGTAASVDGLKRLGNERATKLRDYLEAQPGFRAA